MLYAALGDSITYGYCSTDSDKRYVARLHKLLGGRQPLNLYVHAHPGWTSGKLLQTLHTIPDAVWDETRLVTLMIGGNDLLRAIPFLLNGSPGTIIRVSERLHRNINAIVDKVSRPHSTVVLGTLYNPFPNSPIAERCTDALNRAITCVAEREGTVLADVRTAFVPKAGECIDGYRKGMLRDIRIVGNPIHPNDQGHDLIAKIFHAAYRKSLAQVRQLRRNLQ